MWASDINWNRIKRQAYLSVYIVIAGISFTGCINLDGDTKAADLEYTILAEKEIPEEMLEMINARKIEPIHMVYYDEASTYMVVGYGEKQSGGYSVTVNALYEGEKAIHLDTDLLGPTGESSQRDERSYPYIVLKTIKTDKNILFEP